MKKLHKTSLIFFNILSLLFGLAMLFSVLCSDQEIANVLSTYVFGSGYSTTEGLNYDKIYYNTKYESIADLMNGSGKNAAAAEAEGAVLLKNESIDQATGKRALPLDKDADKISLFGVTAYNPIYSLRGAGRVEINKNRQQFFKSEMENVGLDVNSGLASWYESNTQYFRGSITGNGINAQINGAGWDEINTSAKTEPGYKTAIYVIGRIGNESIDLPPYSTSSGAEGLTDGDYLKLTAKEKNLLTGLKNEKDNGTFDRIIVLVNTASPIMDDFIDNAAYGIDAALWIGFPGSAGIGAVAQLLVDDATPSGRLATMWYATKNDTPSWNYFGDFNNDGGSYVLYQEGVYAGYRFSETRYEDFVMGTPNAGTYDYSASVRYPFGYGMSYANFSHEFVSLEKDISPDKEGRSSGDDYIATVKVTNTSSVYSGKEVVQIYIQQPYTETNKAHKVEKPAVELIGYAKTEKLAPRAFEEIKIKIDANKYFAAYDIAANKYILDEGMYYLTVAKDAHNAVNNILVAKDKAVSARMTGAGNATLVKTVSVDDARSSSYKYWTQGGAEVTNLFDHADPNKADPLANNISFMSRNNWQGTLSGTHQVVAKSDLNDAGRRLDDNGDFANSKTNYPHYKDEYPTYGKNNNPKDPNHLNLAHMIGVEYEDSRGATDESKQKWEDFLDQLTWKETVKLVGEGRRCTISIDSIAKPYTNDINASNGLNWRFDMGLETEGGGANRTAGFAAIKDNDNRNYYPTGYPCEGIIASTFNIDIAYVVGQSIGEDALWAGASGLYGFGLNLHRSPYQGRAGEYYSEDSYLTGVTAGWSSKGAQSKGLYVYNKHFVLNDQDINRSAHAAWITEQALRQTYLRPFEIAIEIGDAMNVMTSFNRIGSCWSGNDYNLMTRCLRGELGMNGFAVTDWYYSNGMGMANGILAGNDLPDGSAQGNLSGKGPGTGNGHLAQAMRISAQRILYTVANSNAMNFFDENTTVTTYDPVWYFVRDGIIVAITVVFIINAVLVCGTTILQIFKKNKAKKPKGKS